MSFAVLVPVLDRPHRAGPLAESLRSSGADARLVFLCSPGDDAQIIACHAVPGSDTVVVPFECGRGDWARKINHGLTVTDEPFVLCGADDLVFHAGWDLPLLERLDHTGVVGTNDLANPVVKQGRHSTHPAAARWYVTNYGTCDEPDKLVHEGYAHNFADNELVETARARGMWEFAAGSHVEHQHWVWGTAPKDATYLLGAERFREDSALFRRRRALWRNLHPVSNRA